MRLRGQRGDTVRIYHSEILEKGEFFTRNLRKAKALSTYILSGEGEEWLAPRFAFYGFRYIKVEGIDGELNPEDFVAEAISSATPENGTFVSSDSLINRLQSNIKWGMLDNFVDIPTDCPQRDERLAGRRRAGLLPHGNVQPRRADLLQQVDGRRGRRAVC